MQRIIAKIGGVILFLAIFIGMAGVAQAAQIYAAPAALGNGTCDDAANACTIETALADNRIDASDGVDVITLTAGTYTRTSAINLIEELILSGVDKDTVIISADSSLNAHTIIINANTIENDTIIENITVTNDYSYNAINITAGSPTIQNTKVIAYQAAGNGGGIINTVANTFAKIKDNVISSFRDGGVRFTQAGNSACAPATSETNCAVIARNVINGITYDNPIDVNGYTIVYNNILTANTSSDDLIELDGTGNVIANNTIIGNAASPSYYGIRKDGTASAIIINNIIANNTWIQPMYCTSNGGDVIYRNLISGNHNADIDTAGSCAVQTSDQIFEAARLYYPERSKATIKSSSCSGSYCQVVMNGGDLGWVDDEWIGQFLILQPDGVQDSVSYAHKFIVYIYDNDQSAGDERLYVYVPTYMSSYLVANRQVAITTGQISYRSWAVDGGYNSTDNYIDIDNLMNTDYGGNPRINDVANDAANSITIGDGVADIDVGAFEYVLDGDNKPHGAAYNSKLYAEPAGSISNNCQTDLTRCSLDRALEKADNRDGSPDTIYLAQGTYTGSYVVDSNVVLEGNNVATIGPAASGYTSLAFTDNNNTTLVQNIDFIGANVSGARIIWLFAEASPTIQNNKFYSNKSNANSSAVFAFDNNYTFYNYAKIYNNEFYGLGNSASHNATVHFTRSGGKPGCTASDQDNCIVIRGNLFANSHDHSVEIAQGNSYIFNNLFVGNTYDHVISVWEGGNNVLNNTIAFAAFSGSAGSYGIFYDGDTGTANIQNNIFAYNGAGNGSIYCKDGGNGGVKNNLIYGNLKDEVTTSNCTVLASDQIFHDPGFFAPSSTYTTVQSTQASPDNTNRYRIYLNNDVGADDAWVDNNYKYFLVAELDGIATGDKGRHMTAYPIMDNGNDGNEWVDIDYRTSSFVTDHLQTGRNVYITNLQPYYGSWAVDNGADTQNIITAAKLGNDFANQSRTVNISDQDGIVFGDDVYDIDIGALEYPANGAPFTVDNVPLGTSGADALYASPNGCSSEGQNCDCKSLAEACTWQRALDRAINRDNTNDFTMGDIDTINITAGTTTTKNVSVKKDVVITSSNVETTMIQPSDGNAMTLTGVHNDTIIQNLKFNVNNSLNDSGIQLFYGNGPIIQNNIIDSYVVGSYGGLGVYAPFQTAAKVIGNRFHGHYYYYGLQAYEGGKSTCAADNEDDCFVAKRNIFSKVCLSTGSVFFADNYSHVYDNLFVGNKCNNTQLGSQALSTTYNAIFNNTIYANLTGAATTTYITSTFSGSDELHNNIIVNNYGRSMSCRSEGIGRVTHNMINGNNNDVPYENSCTVSDTIAADPAFQEIAGTGSTVSSRSSQGDNKRRIMVNGNPGWTDDAYIGKFLITEVDGVCASYDEHNAFYIYDNGSDWVDVWISDNNTNEDEDFLCNGRNVHITDFKMSASGGIDAGLATTDSIIDLDTIWTTDFLGAPRVQGLNIDVGAVEGQALPTVNFTIANQSGDEDVGTFTITAQLSSTSGNNVSVPYTLGGTATQGAGADYTITASPIIITAGQLNNTITITVNDDSMYEPAETVIVTMGSPTNAEKGATTVHTATINASDSQPSVAFTVAAQNGAEDVGTMTITAQLSNPSYQNISVPFTLGGTATQGAGADYTITASPVAISAGDTEASIVIVVNNDSLDEDDETVIVTMGAPTNAIQGVIKVHTATILDNDAAPTVTFTSGSQNVNENAGTATITAQLSAESGKNISVPFTALGGTATQGAGNDFTITASPLAIGAGSLTADITITVNNDTMDEDDETVVVVMGNPLNATQGATTNHTATILDDDAAPSISFTGSDQAVAETIGNVTITAQLSAVSGKNVSLPFTVGGTAIGGGTDYSYIPASPLTIAAGGTQASITVTIVDDGISEGAETIIYSMGAPTNASLGASTTRTITINANSVTLTGVFDAPQCTSDNPLVCNIDSCAALTFRLLVSGHSNITQSLIDAPAGSSLAQVQNGNTNTATFSWPAACEEGTYNFSIKALAGSGDNITKTVRVIVESAQTAPTVSATAGKLTYISNEQVYIRAIGQDADGDPLTYQWQQTCGADIGIGNGYAQQNLTFNMLNLESLPEARQKMRFCFRVIANDGLNDSAPASIAIWGIKREIRADSVATQIEDLADGDVVGYGNITGEVNELIARIPEDGNTSIEVTSFSSKAVLATYEVPSNYALSALQIANVGESSYDDIIFGVHETSNNRGAVFIAYGPDIADSELSVEGINGLNTIITGVNPNTELGLDANLGRFLAVGNVDGQDNIKDIAITGLRSAYILLGSEDTDPLFEMNELDQTVANLRNTREIWLADINHDGLDDFVYMNNQTPLTYFGPFTGGFLVDLIEENFALNEDIAERPDYNVGMSYGGVALSSGDYNGDGIEDIAVGNANLNQVFIFYGKSSFDQITGFDLADVVITGADAGDQFGVRLGTGYFDDDSISDLVISAYGDDGPDNETPDSGAIYVLYGSTDLEASISASGLLVIYHDSESEEGGIRLYSYDLNGDGISEVIYGTSVHKTIITYMSLLAGADNEILITLGENNPVAQELSATVHDDLVVMQLKATNVHEDDAVLESLTISGGGNAHDLYDVAAVRLYVDADGNGLLENTDYQLGEEKQYDTDDGDITFDNFELVLASGQSAYILVVYDISLAMTYSSHGLSIISATPNFDTLALNFMLIVPLLLLIGLRSNKVSKVLVLSLAVIMLIGLAGCSDQSATSEEGVTFNVSVSANANVTAKSIVTDEGIGVVGAPVTSNTVSIR
ncbi:MAG: Calx-beta domain-containing protein [Pseudomonadota bacterium]